MDSTYGAVDHELRQTRLSRFGRGARPGMELLEGASLDEIVGVASAYYLIRPAREALILSLASGAEYKAYMSGAIAILLLFAVPAYAK